jgi:exo-beta-1,3-glucanase (GH17 family)
MKACWFRGYGKLAACVIASATLLSGCPGGDGDGSVQNSASPAQVAVLPRCVPAGVVPAALLLCRNWITFAPPRPFNPNQNTFPSDDQLRTALTTLHAEGWRGLVTYSLDGNLEQVPRLAKEIGFTVVIAGLFWFDDAQLARERAAALRQLGSIDAFVLGNEGLAQRRYTRQRLGAEIQQLRLDTARPVTTSETLAQYQADPTLASLGDWVFPNLQFWFDPAIRTPALAVTSVQAQLRVVQALAPGRVTVVKEAWWPTAGALAATETNQTEFFRQLAASQVKFIWGEAFDQFWKAEPLNQGPHWGLHTDTGVQKQVITVLQSTYTGPY